MRHFSRINVAAMMLAVCAGMIACADDSRSLLLVVPARPAVVRFCADVARMKNATMVCYEAQQRGGAPVLFLWKALSGDWVKISADDYQSGALLGRGMRRVLIIGTDRAAVAALVELSGRLGDVATIDRLDVMTLANGINDVDPFTSGQWKALARRHDLQLKDLNEDRRRYGRFGKPGEGPVLPKVREPSDLLQAVEPAAILSMPPLEMMEKKAQPLQPAVKSPADK